MEQQSSENESKEGDVLPPQQNTGHIYADILAQIHQYTDRPDLLLETLEKHDPGFIKKMNDAAVAHANDMRAQRFKFGKIQAYTSLVVATMAAIAVLGCVVLLVIYGYASFWTLIGMSFFYAITQGGPTVFKKIADGIAGAISKFKAPSAGQ